MNSVHFVKRVIVLLFVLSPWQSYTFNKIILWGHKMHSHTHSFIHWGFYRAFKHLGYETLWLDKNDSIKNIDFSNSLFITEGQADSGMPIRTDCKYILHNCDGKKYKALFEANKAIILQVYTHDVLTRNVSHESGLIFTDINDKTIYMTWATDLLPHEIEAVKQQMIANPPIKKRICNWIGTVGEGTFGNYSELQPFIRGCKENNIDFKSIYCKATMLDNINAIQESIVAPAIVGEWQREKGYVPCRIFKNISYGQMGATNSKTVYELLDKKILYNQDTYQLFQESYAWANNPNQEQLFELMDLVKNNHTYLNRIDSLLNFLTRVTGH